MNKPSSDSTAALVDFRVDRNTNFIRQIQIVINSVVQDLTYWDAEFVVFYPKTCKIIYNWSLTSGDITVVNDYFIINELIGQESGDYEYYFLAVDPNGDTLKYFKGKFIIE